jgi:anti-sigma B factor antagonist
LTLADLRTEVVRYPDHRILILFGEIDMHTGPGLRDQVFDLIEDSRLPLIVDLSAVTFCDSTGVNIAVAARKHADSRGVTFAFVGLTDRVDRVFRITGMDRLIPTYATLPDAEHDLTRPDRLH